MAKVWEVGLVILIVRIKSTVEFLAACFRVRAMLNYSRRDFSAAGGLRVVVMLLCTVLPSSGEKLRTHLLSDIMEMRLGEEWELQEEMSNTLGSRIISISGFLKKGKEDKDTLILFTDEPQRQVVASIKPKQIADMAAKFFSAALVFKDDSGADVNEKLKAESLIVMESKLLGKGVRLFQQEFRATREDAVIVNGVVWKTDRRTYALAGVDEEKARKSGFWEEFLKGWNERTLEEEIYADIFKVRSRFLTKAQEKKLPEIFKGEWAYKLEIAGMMEKLEKDPSPEKKAELRLWQQMAAARKMRLIYYKLLTPKQKELFKDSLKKQLAARK